MPEIPDYKLVRKIGEGAYGEIWLGISVTGVYRAIKFIERAKFEHDRPYEREFNGIKQYEPVSREHPGLMDILHIGRNEEKQFFYYVMELGDDQHTGQEVNPETYTPKTLRSELTARESLSIKECLEQGAHLARALGHLHSCGLAHRDVKPANIIYVKGKPRLADIGLVKALDDSVSFAGTIGYVPLEGPGRPTGDIFSLGKVLYEMLTGMDRTDFPTLPDHFKDDTRPGLDKLNRIVFKACEHKPDKRYQRADQLATDLEELIGQDLTTASAPAVSSIPVGKLVAALAAVALVIFGVNEFKDMEGAGEEKPSGSSLQTEVYIPIDKNKALSQGGENVKTVLADTVSVPDRSGKEGGAIQFGENSSLVIKNLQDIKALSLWAYLPALRPERGEGNGEYLFDWRVEDQGNVFCLTDTDKFRGQFEKFYLDGELIDPIEVMIPRDKWIHVHVEFSEEFVKEQSKLSSSTLTLMNHHRGNERLAGNLDDIRLYDQILSAGDIWKQYQEEKPQSKTVASAGEDKYTHLKEGLVAYYPFNGNTLDESGNGNDATAHGGVELTSDRHGTENAAYSFDGKNDYMEVIPITGTSRGPGSISLWAKMPKIKKGHLVNIGAIDCGIFVHPEFKKIVGRVTSAAAYPQGSSEPVDCPSNEWAHLCLVWKGTFENAYLYVNGVEATYFKQGDNYFDVQFRIGDKINFQSLRPPMDPFLGELDDVRVYDRALSVDEVNELYDLEKPKSSLEKSLVAYYPFNGNAKDESGNGNHGRVEGATGVADRHGKEASAYSFDGENDSIETGPFTSKIEAYTYSIWARPGRSDTWQTFISSEEVPSNNLNQVWLGFHSSNGVLRFHPNPSDLMDSSSGQVKLNEWSHFACSNDGKYAYFYFNGNLIRRAAVPIESFTDSFKINIGRDYANNPEFYNGLADDLRIYDRALSKEEIEELYNLEKPETALEKGLVAYYPFNGNAKDESGNGNDGTLHPGQFGGLKKQVKDRHGKLGQAFFFDGHSTITVENHPSLDFSEALTISVWVNNAGAGSGHPGVIANSKPDDPNTLSYGLLVGESGDSRHRFTLNAINRQNAKDWFMELQGWEIKNRQQWSHVVATYNGASANIYLNGELAKSMPAKNQKIDVLKTPILIGSVGGLRYSGDMDDLRLYSRGLSAKEVKELYNLEKPKADIEKGLVAFYPFNANAADESGNGNHGKVEGATRVADRHGKEVSAYQFDGKDDFIDLGKIRFGNEVTFSAWVKNESDDHVSLFGNSDGQEGGDAGPYVYSLALGLGRDGSVGWDVSTDGVSRRGLGSPPGGIKVGRMHHIVCTYGQGKQEIYIDGKFVAGKKDTPLAIHNSGLPVVIGASRAFVRPIFNGPGKQVIQHLLRGQMDDVRIYSRLLSSKEVAELYSYERPKID